MANNMLDMDLAYPDLSKYDTTEKKLAVIQDYLYLLLENLRYALRNLNMNENFNQEELEEWVDDLNLVAKSIWADEIYSKYGAIADLCVNRLRTDYMRAERWLAGDSSPIDYIYIHDEEIDFYTGKVLDPSDKEQLHYWGRYFWWMEDPDTTPADKRRMTYTEETEWPVWVYVYDDQYGDSRLVKPKASIRFQDEEDSHGNVYRVPVFTFGQGSQAAVSSHLSQGRLFKHTDGLELSFLTEANKRIGVYQYNSGYMDLIGLRKVTALDFSELAAGGITVSLEGGVRRHFALTYDGDDNIVEISGDGLSVPVAW